MTTKQAITITPESNASNNKFTTNHYDINCKSEDQDKAREFADMMCEKWHAESDTEDDSFGEFSVNLSVIESHETKTKQIKSLRAELKAFLAA